MGKKRLNRTKKKVINIIYKIIAIISTIIAVIFSIFLFALNMLPLKFLILIYIVLFILYIILLFLVFKSKIKIIVKTFCILFFLIFNIIFCVGIKYIYETISFVETIDNKIQQKEEYYIMSMEISGYNDIKNLETKNIGIYKTINSQKAIDELLKKINFNEIDFVDATDMFDALEEKEIDAILINGSMKNLLETDFKDLFTRLKEVYNIDVSINKKDDIVKVVDVARKPFNIYVAGGDAYGNIGNVTNTDVNMIATVDPINKKILLTSIPRDYYVNLPSFGENAYDKLTHAGYYGIEESVQAIEKLLDIDINYYVKVNFSTIEGVINAIGGVTVNSEYNFCTYGGPQVCYSKGNNYLKGYEALMFARERHAFTNGDVQRVKNQQKVLTAIINKVSTSTVLITSYTDILDNVSTSFVTNLDNKSISRLIKMQINDMTAWNIESQNLVGSDMYSDSTFTFPDVNLYVMEPNEDSINNAIENIKKIINKV